MTNRFFFTENAVKFPSDNTSSVPVSVDAGKVPQAQEVNAEGKFVVISPTGAQIEITKELYIALSDFMKTRRHAGSITVQFRQGEILCVEVLVKKTYRNS